MGTSGKRAPRYVTRVRIHSSVGAIKARLFNGRGQLMIVILNDELEEIGMMTLEGCTSLYEIVIPNAVKTIDQSAFAYCRRLTAVTLGEGLVEIGH